MALGRERTRREWFATNHVVVASALVATAALGFALVRPDATLAGGLAGAGLAVVALAVLELFWHPDRRLPALGSLLVVSVATVGGAWLAVVRLGVQRASVVLLVGTALAMYLLYRYQLVVLGLVEGDR